MQSCHERSGSSSQSGDGPRQSPSRQEEDRPDVTPAQGSKKSTVQGWRQRSSCLSLTAMGVGC